MTIPNQWFVRTSNKIHGPFSAKQIKQLAAESKIARQTLVRRDSNGKWVPAEKVKGLFDSANSPSHQTAKISPQPAAPKEEDVADWIAKPEPSKTTIASEEQAPTQPPPPPAPTRQPGRPPALEQPATTVHCPYCSESVKSTAKKCKHCGEYLDAELAAQRSGAATSGPNPGIVAFLNLILPGSGYIYMGHMGRGISYIVVSPLLYLFLWAVGYDLATRDQEMLGALFCYSFPVILHLAIVVDSCFVARRQQNNSGSPSSVGAHQASRSSAVAQQTGTKPPEITKATRLLWTAFGIGCVNGIIDLLYYKSPDTFSVVVSGFVLVILAILISSISAGKNWARITTLVLFILGLVPFLFALLEIFSRSVPVGLLSVVQALLQAQGLYLLFTNPGASWYRKEPVA